MLQSLRWPLDTVMLLKGDLLQNKYTLKIFIWASAREQWPTPVSVGARQIKDLQQVWLILTEYVANSMKGKGEKNGYKVTFQNTSEKYASFLLKYYFC